MRKLSLSIFLSFFVSITYAQKGPNAALTADSLASGSYNDVLKSFFQLAFNKVISQNKEINFTSNPFAVMAKMDTSLIVDTKYYKYRQLRDLNFSFGVKLDSSYKFNGFSSGIKYAIINRRDETVSAAFLASVADDSRTRLLYSLNDSLEAYISTLKFNSETQNKIRNQKGRFYRGEISFDSLDNSLQKKIMQLAKKQNSS